MPKTKQWTPRRVTNEDERGSGSSQYISLVEGEKFLGFALFEADPAATKDTGYYEYMEHWVQGAGRGTSVPCAGEDCPFCEDGDRPRTRAKTLWFVVTGPKGEDVNELRIFNFNYNIIKQMTELRSEGDKIKGRLFRISRLDDRGNYAIMPKDTVLKVAEVKEYLADPSAPDFDDLVTSQLRKAMEGVALARALDDDDEEETPARGRSRAKAKAEEDEPEDEEENDEWPEDAEGMIVTIVEVDAEENNITVESDDFSTGIVMWGTDEVDVTEFDPEDVVEISYVADEAGDLLLTDDPLLQDIEAEGEETEEEEEEETEDGELPDLIEDQEFVIVSVDTENETLEVESEELGIAFTLFFLDQGPAAEVDFDDYKESDKIIVSCEKDSQDDMVATAVPEVVKAKTTRRTAAKATGRKTTAAKTATTRRKTTARKR